MVLCGHCNISLPAFHRDRVFKVIGNPAEVRRAARITSRLSLARAAAFLLILYPTCGGQIAPAPSGRPAGCAIRLICPHCSLSADIVPYFRPVYHHDRIFFIIRVTARSRRAARCTFTWLHSMIDLRCPRCSLSARVYHISDQPAAAMAYLQQRYFSDQRERSAVYVKA